MVSVPFWLGEQHIWTCLVLQPHLSPTKRLSKMVSPLSMAKLPSSPKLLLYWARSCLEQHHVTSCNILHLVVLYTIHSMHSLRKLCPIQSQNAWLDLFILWCMETPATNHSFGLMVMPSATPIRCCANGQWPWNVTWNWIKITGMSQGGTYLQSQNLKPFVQTLHVTWLSVGLWPTPRMSVEESWTNSFTDRDCRCYSSVVLLWRG